MPLADPVALAGEIRTRSAGRRLLVLCDFDGTLSGFDPDPGAVWLPGHVRESLVALGRRATVGLVSGRQLSDLRARADVGDDAYYAGSHGLEIEGGGAAFVHRGAHGARALLDAMAAAITPELAGIDGAFLEDKELGIVAHFRAATPEGQARVAAIVERHGAPHVRSGRLRLMHGAEIRELLPNVGWDKGSAVRWIAEHVEAQHGPAFVLYVGDDVTDEDAFRAVRGSGLAVAASDRTSGADVRIDGPAAVERLLDALR